MNVLREAAKIVGRKARHLSISDLMELGSVTVVESMRSYDPLRGGFRSHALPRVVGAMKDELRKETRRYWLLASTFHEEFFDHIFEERADLRREVEALSPRHRSLVEMVDGAGYEALEVGRLYKISKSRASRLRKEALEILKKRLS